MLASVTRKPLNKDMTLVGAFTDLVAIAKEEGTVIFYNRRGKFVYYFVQVADRYYYCRMEEGLVDLVDHDDLPVEEDAPAE